MTEGKARRAWSSDDNDSLRRLNSRGLNARESGEIMNRHPDMICRHQQALGLPSGQSPAQTMMMARINIGRLAARSRASSHFAWNPEVGLRVVLLPPLQEHRHGQATELQAPEIQSAQVER